MSADELHGWNESRRIASRLLQAVDDGSFEQLIADLPHETPSYEEVVSVRDDTDGRTDAVNTLARNVRDTAVQTNGTSSTTGDIGRNPLGQWNDARRLATQLLNAVEEDDYETVVSEYDQIAFPPESRVRDKVMGSTGSRTERINEIARWVLNWEDMEWEEAEPDDVEPSQSKTASEDNPLSHWNDARRLASQLLDAVEDGDYETVVSEYEWVEFPPEPHARHKVSQFTGPRTERINEIARWVLDWEDTDWEGTTFEYSTDESAAEDDPEQGTDTQEVEDTVEIDEDDLTVREQAAADILENFRNHEGRYGSIIREYSQLDLPPQPEMMMAVHRTAGTDKRQAIDELSEIIEEWESTNEGVDDGHPRSRYVYGQSSPHF